MEEGGIVEELTEEDVVRGRCDVESGGIVETLTEEDVVRGRLDCGRGGNSRGVDRRGRCQR